MDERPGSPEIDVVGDGDHSQRFRPRSERFFRESGRNSTSSRAANENGANRLAANTNNQRGKKAETVNLRVRNMGVVLVKKEPESDEDYEGSYSLSSLLEECDFDKTQRRNKSPLKSPTSFATANWAKSIESARPGKPSKSLENVISSLKSGRSVNDNKQASRPSNIQNPPASISMPSATPTPPNVFGPPGSGGSVGGIGPQIVDVRSLASVVRPAAPLASVPVKQVSDRPVRQALSRPLNAGHQRQCVMNSTGTTPYTPRTHEQVPTVTSTAASVTKPVNIRFVLPANVPFNTDQFQQVLQATLASLSSQSTTIEPDQLQRAIQAALTSVTKSTVAFNPTQLQQAIHNSLAAVTGSLPISQVAPTTLSPTAVYLPRSTQRQPQTIAPKPPVLPLQPTVMRVESTCSESEILAAGNAVNVTKEKQLSSPASIISPATMVTERGSKTSDNGPVVNGNSNGQPTPKGLSSSHLSSARDALVKALQTNPVLNSPASLASSMVAAPTTTTDSFDHDTVLDSPPTSPAPPATEAPVSSSSTTCSSGPAGSVTQTASNATSKGATIVLDSQTYLGKNKSPIPAGTQTSLATVPAQLNTQSSITASQVKPVATPVNTNMSSVSSGLVLSSGAAMPVSNTTSVNLQISVPVNFTSAPVNNTDNKKSTAPVSKAAATGCGCCSNCKNTAEREPEPEDLYMCYFKGCESSYKTLTALRKHHYFYPNHKPRIPLEKASHSVDYFLPEDLSELHRSARLRELFRRLSNEEIKELIMPRMIKTLTLFDLLELKSARAQPSRGQPSISPFKMFSEFERFRKEVETRLLELILLPQGRSSKNAKKEEKPLGAAKDPGATESTKQENKDAPPSINISDQKAESSASQPNTVSSASSAATKKTVETICIDSETDKATASPVTGSQDVAVPSADKPSSSQGDISGAVVPGTTEEAKKTGDTCTLAVEKTSDESVKESSKGESLKASKESSSSAQSLAVTDGTKPSDTKTSDDEPSGSEQPTNATGSSPTAAVTRDSTLPMETDELPKKDVGTAGGESSAAESTDVIMVDAQDKTEPSKEGELKSSEEENMKAAQDPVIEKIDVDMDIQEPNVTADKVKASTGEDKQLSITGGEDKSKEKSEKHPNLVSVENKGEVDALEKKDSAAAERDDTGKVVDKTAANSEGDKTPAVVNVEEHAKTDKDKSETGDISEEKSGNKKTKQAPQASMATDEDGKVKVDSNKGGDGQKETDKENKLREDPINDASKSSEKASETAVQMATQKESESTEKGKVDESVNASSSLKVATSSNASGSTTVGSCNTEKPTGSDNSVAEDKTAADSSSCTEVMAENDTTAVKDKADSEGSSSTEATAEGDATTEAKAKIREITIDPEEDIDENNLLEFGLAFVVKWGKVIKKVEAVEARKIARKENYSEQDMKQFIYGKPKEAANAVISSECHAHPSFFRAYVMPALLDKHIDDFGLFGKKLLSRLLLPRKKYVDVLRNSVGPELAKILGINIFPTFKRIQDTWQSIKMPLPVGKSKNTLVLVPLPGDEREVPDDEDEAAPTDTTIRPASNSVQNAAGKGNDLLKRPSPTDSQQNDNNKKQRLDNSVAQKETSQTDKEQTGSSEKGSDKSADSSGKNATGQSDGNNKSQEQQSGSAEKEKDTTSASDKSTATENKTGSASSTGVPDKEPAAGNTSASSAPLNKPEHAYSKPSTSKDSPSNSTSAASIIPKKATIYTSSGSKVGASSLPFSSPKGSPLYLVPVEKLSSKLVEQFINQGKGDGVRTRSASSAKKGKQPKQGSQVLVLVPSSNPNGSPTIQALTSAEQLKSNGDKKPLLLLPADKVPKSMASQSPSVRRKMVITMVAPSSGSGSTTQSAAQSVTTTSASTAGGQQKDSVVPAVQGPIMSTREGGTGSNVSPATVSESSAAGSTVTCEAVTSDDPKPAEESMDTSTSSTVTVITSPLNTPIKDCLVPGIKSALSSVPTDVNQSDSAVSKESDSDSKTSSAQSSEPASAPDKATEENEKSQTSTISANASVADSQDSGGLDILGSSLLPSDLTLDNLLKDITTDGSGSEANEIPPLDISEIISSFEDIPIESEMSITTSSSHDADSAASQGAFDSDNEIRSQGSALDDDHSSNARRQSPRRAPAPSKSTPVSSLADDTSGGSREGSDLEDGSPPRKRRKTPTRTSTRASPQVTFVPDKEVAGKGSIGSPSRGKGRKQ